MKYSELLKLYKEGKLPEEEKKTVENDIERQEAISEYLYLNDEEDIVTKENNKVYNETGNAKDFTKEIRASIRRAFIKAGIAVGAALLILMIIAQTALPKIADKFYYEPTTLIPEPEHGGVYHYDSVSDEMRVYSELLMPHLSIDKVLAIGKGYGEYSFEMMTAANPDSLNAHVYVGEIKRGRITFFNTSDVRPVAWDLFERRPIIVEDLSMKISDKKNYQSRRLERKDVESFADTGKYMAYVTFDSVIGYDDTISFCEKYNLKNPWVCFVNDDYYYPVGFYPYLKERGATISVVKDYPYLFGYKDDMELMKKEGNPMTEDAAKQHLVSMMRYMDDHKKFFKMMEAYHRSEIVPANSAKYIEKNGIQIYGVSVIIDKTTMLELMEDKEVYGIQAKAAIYY